VRPQRLCESTSCESDLVWCSVKYGGVFWVSDSRCEGNWDDCPPTTVGAPVSVSWFRHGTMRSTWTICFRPEAMSTMECFQDLLDDDRWSERGNHPGSCPDSCELTMPLPYQRSRPIESYSLTYEERVSLHSWSKYVFSATAELSMAWRTCWCAWRRFSWKSCTYPDWGMFSSGGATMSDAGSSTSLPSIARFGVTPVVECTVIR